MRNKAVLGVWGIPTNKSDWRDNKMSKKGYIKRGNIIVTCTGDVCCTKDDCPHINCIGCCTDINAECKYSSQRNDALLHYAFEDDKEVEIVLRQGC